MCVKLCGSLLASHAGEHDEIGPDRGFGPFGDARQPGTGVFAAFCLKVHDSLLFLLLQAQYGQAFQVPREANQRPFTGDFVQATRGELTKARKDLMMPNAGSTVCLHKA